MYWAISYFFLFAVFFFLFPLLTFTACFTVLQEKQNMHFRCVLMLYLCIFIFFFITNNDGRTILSAPKPTKWVFGEVLQLLFITSAENTYKLNCNQYFKNKICMFNNTKLDNSSLKQTHCFLLQLYDGIQVFSTNTKYDALCFPRQRICMCLYQA